MLCSRRSMLMGLALSIVSGIAGAAGEPAIVPVKGQSPAQMERDKAECLAAALQASSETASAAALQGRGDTAMGEAPPGGSAAAPGEHGPAVKKTEPAGVAPQRAGLFGGLGRPQEAVGSALETTADEASGSAQTRTVLDGAYVECLKARGYTVN